MGSFGSEITDTARRIGDRFHTLEIIVFRLLFVRLVNRFANRQLIALHGADKRAKHHIECPRLAKRITVRTLYAKLDDFLIHLRHRQAVRTHTIIFKDMISPVTLVIDRVLAQRIDERINMPARLPYLLVHQDRRVDAEHILA